MLSLAMLAVRSSAGSCLDALEVEQRACASASSGIRGVEAVERDRGGRRGVVSMPSIIEDSISGSTELLYNIED